jgi:hypothetical protein
MMTGDRPEPCREFAGRASLREEWTEIRRHLPRAMTLRGQTARPWRTCRAGRVVPETGESDG